MPADIAPGNIVQAQQAPDSADPIVVFEDVSITFDIKPVLQNISFTVHRGETRIILGPAGGGKSVLMKLANGLIRPDSEQFASLGKTSPACVKLICLSFANASAWSSRNPRSSIPSL